MATTTSAPTKLDSCGGRPPTQHIKKKNLQQYTCRSCSQIYQLLASAMFPQVLLTLAEAKININDFLTKNVALFADPETETVYRACGTCGETEDLVRHCPECQSINIVEDDKTDITNCRDCGLVLLGPPPCFVAYHKITYAWGGASLNRTMR